MTEDEKEGKSKMIASCGFLEDELRQFSREERVTMADSVDSLGVDLRTRVKKLGAKEKARRMKCRIGFSLTKKKKASQKSYLKVGVKKLLRAGMMPARTWGVHAFGDGSNGEVEIEETDGSSRQKEYDFSALIYGSVWP